MRLQRPKGRLRGRELYWAVQSIQRMRRMDGVQADGRVVVGCWGLGRHYPMEDAQCCRWCNPGVFSPIREVGG